MRRFFIIPAVLALFFCGQAAAENMNAENERDAAKQLAAEKWGKLSSSERDRIKKIYTAWRDIPPQRRAWIIKNHRKLKGMDEGKKAEIEEAYAEWEKLSPHVKELMIERYREWKNLTGRERVNIRRAAERYSEMSPEERAEARRKVKEAREAREREEGK